MSLCVGMEMVENEGCGFWKKEREKKNGKKRNEVGNEIKGDGYGNKNGWVKKEMGIGVEFT